MNNKDRNMLNVARVAINIPATGNRASISGYSSYDRDMRDILAKFNMFVFDMIGGDDAEDSLNELVACSVLVFSRCNVSMPKVLVEWLERK